MTYYAFIHSRSGLTRPVLAGEFKGRDKNDAHSKAVASPAVKKIVGSQSAKDLYVFVYEASDYRGAADQAMEAHMRCLEASRGIDLIDPAEPKNEYPLGYMQGRGAA